MPDLALSLSFFTLFYCLFAFDGWRQLFRDSDTGWHIRTGETILTTHHLPTTDPYSFTRAGERWFAWEWASDTVMASAYKVGLGIAGVAVLYAVAIAAASYLWVRLNWQAGGEFLVACVAAVPMLSTVNLHWLARPHVFSWLLLMLTVSLAMRREVVLKTRGVIAVSILSIVWTNIHASFFLLPVVLLVFAAGNWLEHLLYERSQPRNAKPLLQLAGVALLASLVNPYGWQVHAHVLRYLTNSELLDRIGEFQTFNFHVEGAWQIVILMAWIALGGSLALQQGKLAHALFIGLLFALALRSARGLPIAALVAMPLANGAISTAIREGFGFRAAWRDRLLAFAEYSQRLRQHDRQSGGWILTVPVMLLVLLAARGNRDTAGFPRDQFPLEAASSPAMLALPGTARILAPDKFGGYLIYRFNGERKVYFDGRSDFYGSDFMKRYIQLVEVRPGWREELDRWQFSHALLPNRYSLIPALQQVGWKIIHRDSVATLLAKEGSSE